MRRLAPFLVLLIPLAACDTAGPRYRGIAPVTVTAGGHVYDVYLRGQDVQILRTDMVWLPNRDAVFEGAAVAVRLATGCALREGSLKGDVALMNGRVTCG